jgi:hypothetical protein
MRLNIFIQQTKKKYKRKIMNRELSILISITLTRDNDNIDGKNSREYTGGKSEDTYVFGDFYVAQMITKAYEAATMSVPCRAVPCWYGNNSNSGGSVESRAGPVQSRAGTKSGRYKCNNSSSSSRGSEWEYIWH